MGEVSGSTLTAATRERVAFPPRAERSARRASALVEVLLLVQTMSRLMCDVNMPEEWELRRLEPGESAGGNG